MKRTCTSLLAFLTSAMFFVSCGAKQKPYPAVTEVKDGIKTITNPNFPRDGSFTAKLTEEISLGGEGSSADGVLSNPYRVRVDARGNVYVHDTRDVNIKVYDAAGRFVRAIGRKGQGPGEFAFLADFDLMTDGRVAAYDTSQGRVSILTAEGKYLSGFKTQGFYKELSVDEGDVLLLRGSEELQSGAPLSKETKEFPLLTIIACTDVAGKALVRLASLAGEYWMMSNPDGSTVRVSFPDRMILWVLRPGGGFYAGFNEVYEIGVYGPDGRKQFVFGRRFAPVENAHYKGLAGERKTMPAYRGIVTDEQGSVWFDLYRPEREKGHLYDVFSPEGIFLKQVSVPQEIACFKNGRIYSILRPEDGFPSVKRYRMELVPAAR